MRRSQIIAVLFIFGSSPISGQNVDLQGLLEKGEDLQNQFLYDSAITFYKPAAIILREKTEWKNYFITINTIARCYSIVQKFDSSSFYLSKAEHVLNTKLNGEDSLNAVFKYASAQLLRRKGDFLAAIAELTQSLSSYQKSAGEENILLADIYNSLGNNYGEIGDRDSEIRYFEKSLKIVIEKPRLWADELVYNADLATRYSNLGTSYHNRGDCSKGLSYYFKALSLDKKVFGEKHPYIAQDFNLISSALSCLQRFDEAIEYQTRSQEMYMAIFGDEHYKLGYGFNNMGLAYFGKKDYNNAIKNLSRGVEIFRKLYPKGNYRTADALFNLGRAYVQTGKFEKARSFLYESKNIMLQSDPQNFRIFKANDMIGWSYFRQGHYSKALESIQSALEGFAHQSTDDLSSNPGKEVVGSLYLFGQTLSHKSQVLTSHYQNTEDVKDLEFALETSEYAIAVLNDVLINFKQEASQIELQQQAIEVYEQAINTASILFEKTADVQYLEQIFKYIEQSKAYVLRQSFQEKKAQSIVAIPDSMKMRELSLRKEISDYQIEINKASNTDDSKITELRGNLFDTQTEFEDFVKDLELSYPKYYQGKYQQKVISLGDVQRGLNPSQLFLNFFVGDSSLNLICISKNEVTFRKIQSEPDIINTIQLYQKSISDFQFLMEQPQDADSTYLVTAQTLYKYLISPIAESLNNINHLVISPDGYLNQISFEAFVTETIEPEKNVDYQALPYLLTHHSISYANSASLYIEEMRSDITPGMKLAGFAPGYDIDHLLSADTSSVSLKNLVSTGNWELSGARYEVETIAEIMKGDTYVDEQATETNFKRLASRYKILHLAMHGVVNSNNQETELIFSKETTLENDGILQLSEVYNLDLNARLAVLGSCQSGTGQLKKGEDVLSVSRAFQYANCPSVIIV